MTKHEFTSQVIAAAKGGSLVTGKHDPSRASVPEPTFRTVLTPAASSSLMSELSAGNVVVTEYQSAKYPNPQYVVELTSAGVSPVGLGIPSGSAIPTSQCDRLVFVSGSQQGWHVYADDQARLNNQVASGSLSVRSLLT
jgi:hypothetical protein